MSFLNYQILELLWKDKFTTLDGLGALVISPTRELVNIVEEITDQNQN